MSLVRIVARKYGDHLRQAYPKWSPGRNMNMSQITCALSNDIYIASQGKEKFLLRLYGSTSHGLFTREAEVEQACFLASHGFGAKVLHTFEEGRVESFLNGRTPTNDEMRTPEAIRVIARKLRQLHDDTGLNHNDLHRNNMLVNPDGSVEFLDFEYSGPADPTYDIANHFNEWMYPYEGDDPELFREELYPSLSQRRDFCAAYLGREACDAEDEVVNDFVEQVERRRGDSHAFWVAWSDKTGPSEFNDKYAQARRTLLPGSEAELKSE